MLVAIFMNSVAAIQLNIPNQPDQVHENVLKLLDSFIS